MSAVTSRDDSLAALRDRAAAARVALANGMLALIRGEISARDLEPLNKAARSISKELRQAARGAK